ncbi:tetratricopeptide repeat protein [Flavobacterium sp. JP2137]|uniref:tetratricopeptide repeat protein n=1 Tax=Flavobacterium sp. JP2137 TaxID=3414510 RepID=UPI003D301141
MEHPFKEIYQSYLDAYTSDKKNLSEAAKQFFTQADYSEVSDWYRAHALCEVAVDAAAFDEDMQRLHQQIYSESWNYHCSMRLSEEDYAAWFAVCKNLNDRVIALGYNRAYCVQYDLIDSARAEFKDENMAHDYLMKGVAQNDAASLGTYGYNVYYGIKGAEAADPEAAWDLLQRSKSLGFEQSGLLSLNLKYYTATSEEAGWQAIQEHIDVIEKEQKGRYIYADFYLRKGEDEQALSYLEKGIEEGSAYCKYLLGLNIVNQRFKQLEAVRGIQLLKEAFDYGVLLAGYTLGYHYSYSRAADQDIDKAIYYFERALEYGLPDAIFELALIRIYHPERKDFERGMALIDQLIQREYPRAFSEKAYILMESPDVERDLDTARALLDKAMEMGNDYAPYRIGMGYQNAEFSEKEDFETALEYFEIAASRNNLTAIEMIGRYYRYGYTGEPDAEKALAHYRKAVDDFNSDYARIELAMCYEQGFGVQQNFETAKTLYEQALENQYLYAAIRLAYLYEDNYLGTPNPTLAFEYFDRAAQAGIAEAKYHVARFYRYGVGMPENPERALQHFQEALDLGYIDAHVDLGLAHEEGYGGLPTDPQQALQHMTAAAEQGIAYAQYKLGCYHSYGFLDVQDLSTGKAWFEKAYENGSALAALSLGDYYLYGYENTQEYDRAMEFYSFAEQHGYVSEGMGICYEFELGVDKSLTEAFKYYKIASERGYADGTYRLGMCHYYGKGTDEDKPEAFFYFKQLADEEHVDAQNFVAMMLLKGEGIERDVEEGITYLILAAEAGNDSAQYELGNCYLKGEGVVQDDDMAMQWYQKAAENGHEQAMKITGNSPRRRR